MIFFKLKAGALQLTMFIVVVIALLLASFVVLLQAHKRFSVQTDFVIETVDNAQKGIEYALHNTTPLSKTITVNLNDEDYKELLVKRGFWGVFEKVTATASIKTNTFTKTALIGGTQSKIDRTALYIKDNNKPLVVVGNTIIQGTVYLPKQGVRPGNISGRSYYGSQLIYGPTKLSNDFPKIAPETLEYLEDIFSNDLNVQQYQFLDLEKSRVHKNSFLKPLQIVFSNSTIDLSGISLTGHIRVHSKTKIIVEATSRLRDVVLIAPKIEIKNNVEGQFQALTTERLVVGENCKLVYPSALVLNKKRSILKEDTKQGKNQGIIIGKNSKVKGVVMFLGATELNNYQPQIQIEENATVYGEVFCTQNLELKGTVFGSVFTNNFIAAQSGSIYQNHIYNGTIIVDKLPQEYVGLPFNNSKKEVLKWLY